ncbi:MAG: citramalate synthase [Spirochaetaceae bacterium]|jgi:2-isopropylmalate synthase|nr:citramalate synthase [Spirochaetaceae bacterium]
MLAQKNLSGMDIEIFDTSLRDGAQGEGISFSVRDKLALTATLDELGVAWIEAGNPGSNPKDNDFFKQACQLKLSHARLCAFGSTRKKGTKPEHDPQLASLLSAETEWVVFFGKSSALHVREILKASLNENLDMIAETTAYLVRKGRHVIYDAEHFFDGMNEDKDYALKTLRAAFDAGAERLVLCDTNGGSFPGVIAKGVKTVLSCLPPPQTALVGIHAHNDMGLALACSFAAIDSGCNHVQGTLLGFGERCGNTPLAALIPSLELKLNRRCLPEGRLSRLSLLARRAAEIANISLHDDMPYIGSHAFSHKAGMHADAVLKSSISFEHVDPVLVGNERRILMSEQGGRGAIAARLAGVWRRQSPGGGAELTAGNLPLTKDAPEIAEIARRIKTLEAEGWQFEGADASFLILAHKVLGTYISRFTILAYRVTTEHPAAEALECSYAWVKVLVDGRTEIAAAEGDGPVNALDAALRRSLLGFFPELIRVRLSDYKVRVIDGKEATAAKVRVLIESTDGEAVWTTVGVSEDIIDASRAALVDSIEYKLGHIV